MRDLSTRFAIGLLALSFAVPAMADPPDAVRKFISEPVSLFTFGLYKLAKRMDDLASEGIFGSGWSKERANAVFNWETGHIRLEVNLFPSDDMPDPSTLEVGCKRAIDGVRAGGGIDPKTGKPNGSYSFYASEFFPEYGVEGITGEEAKALDALTEISVYIPGGFLCTAPLLGTGYAVQK